MANSADQDQLADLALHVCKDRVYPGSAELGLTMSPYWMVINLVFFL